MTGNKITSKIHYPIKIENEYKRLLLSFNRSVKKRITTSLLPLVNKRDISSLYNFDADDDIDLILDQISQDMEREVLLTKRASRLIGSRVIDFTLRNIKDSIAEDFIRPSPTFGVNIFANNDINLTKLSRAWSSTNARLITSIPSELLDNVARVVNSGFRNGSTITVIKADLQKQFKISDNRAKLIARDQIAKLSSDVARYQSLQLGFDFYIWVTANDDRVRKSHSVLNGKVCSWKDPTVYKNNIQEKKWRKRSSIGGVELNIGQDFQCRCSPRVAVLSD